MRFARFVYVVAALFGFVSLVPMYFLKDKISIQSPPAITHPEFYYGFVGLALVFQLLFVFIALDPARYCPLMPVTVLEKLAFSAPVFLLHARGEIGPAMLTPAGIDLALGGLFAIAYFRVKAE